MMQASAKYRILFICTIGSGGTWPPVAAVMKALESLGHETMLVAEPGLCDKVGSENCFPVPENFGFTRFYDEWIEKAVHREVDPAIPAFLTDWADSLVEDVAAAADIFQPQMIISCFSCVDLAWQLSRRLLVPWCMVNPACYFGERSLSPLDKDFEPGVATGINNYYPERLRQASLVLHATDNRFDPQPEPLPPNNFCPGPLDWEKPKELPAYLDEPGDPWVMYSGSTAAGEEHFQMLEEVQAVLETLPVRLIVTHPAAKSLRGKVSNTKFYFEDALPHSSLMPKCAVFVGPAGHGKVLKCLRAALPMVIFDMGSDQRGVARRAVATGSAKFIHANEFSRERLRDEILSVLNEPSFKFNASTFSEYLRTRHIDSAHQAADAVIRTIQARLSIER